MMDAKEQATGYLTAPKGASDFAKALPDDIRRKLSWHDIKRILDALAALENDEPNEIERLAEEWRHSQGVIEDDGWVKCSERLPEVSGKDIEVKAIACQRGWDIETITVDTLTHWRNLPPPPEDKE